MSWIIGSTVWFALLGFSVALFSESTAAPPPQAVSLEAVREVLRETDCKMVIKDESKVVPKYMRDNLSTKLSYQFQEKIQNEMSLMGPGEKCKAKKV